MQMHDPFQYVLQSLLQVALQTQQSVFHPFWSLMSLDKMKEVQKLHDKKSFGNIENMHVCSLENNMNVIFSVQ